MKRTTFLLPLPDASWRDKLRQLLLRLLPASPSEVLLRGRALDEAGDPVAFARVELGGTPYATEANAAGHFVLHVPEAQFRHPLSLFVQAPGFARFEQRLEGAPATAIACSLYHAGGAKVVRLPGHRGQ
ncbi:carboxypeptidase-like regulatory domain-containing protein [Flaviaesturariibacter terrae]